MGGTYLFINKTTGELDHKQQNDTADAVYESPDTYADWKSKKKWSQEFYIWIQVAFLYPKLLHVSSAFKTGVWKIRVIPSLWIQHYRRRSNL